MKTALRMLKNFATAMADSPVATLTAIGKGLLYTVWVPPRVERLRRLTEEGPLLLHIETINACNAACTFCAYPGMERKKGVMSMALFEKLVKQYAALGGGPLSITPMMGDALLDPHLLERLRLLAAHPEIRQITMTTNAIALDTYSDDEVRLLLKTLYCLQVSIGGLDADTYRRMYGVDRFPQVMDSLQRLERLRGELPQGAQLTFAFRTNDSKFESRFQRELDGFRSRGIFVSHMSIFANYAGGVSEVNHGELSFARNQSRKKTTCISPRLSIAVCWDGRITACGCADFEGDKLPLGRADQDELAAVWRGERRKAILRSFGKGKVHPICRNCSAYTPDTFFAEHCFDGIEPQKPLPLDFFHNMMT